MLTSPYGTPFPHASNDLSFVLKYSGFYQQILDCCVGGIVVIKFTITKFVYI